MEKAVKTTSNYHYNKSKIFCIIIETDVTMLYREQYHKEITEMRTNMKNIKQNTLESVKCNKCGKEILVNDGIIKEGVFGVNYNWGYFSEKDGENHSFDLCEKCYDEMIESFVINPDIKLNSELI